VRIDAGPLATLAPRKELRRDVLGELGFRIWLRSRLPEPVADTAAAGWGGDRLVAYGDDKGGAPVVVDLSTWDTVADAAEAARALVTLFAKMTGGPLVKGATQARFVDPNGEAWSVEVRGDKVLCVLGAPAADAAVVEEAWKVLRPASTGPR
jgi:hypothetical protein